VIFHENPDRIASHRFLWDNQEIEQHRRTRGTTMSGSSEPASMTVQEKKERIETSVMLTKGRRPRFLNARMMDFTIPGVSIAVINDYHVERARGYGTRKRGEPVGMKQADLSVPPPLVSPREVYT
jgi:hypothetical protein